MHRTQGLPSPSSTCAARTVCPSASRQRPPTPTHRGRGLAIKAMDEGCTGPKRPVRAGSSCALERCLVCPCAGREQGHARVWHHQHHCFFCRSRNCCCPKNGCVRAGRCCTRARFLCLTFGKKKAGNILGVTDADRPFPNVSAFVLETSCSQGARQYPGNRDREQQGGQPRMVPLLQLAYAYFSRRAGIGGLGAERLQAAEPHAACPWRPLHPWQSTNSSPLRGGDHASKRPRRH